MLNIIESSRLFWIIIGAAFAASSLSFLIGDIFLRIFIDYSFFISLILFSTANLKNLIWISILKNAVQFLLFEIVFGFDELGVAIFLMIDAVEITLILIVKFIHCKINN